MVKKSFFCIAIGISSFVLFSLAAYGQELKSKERESAASTYDVFLTSLSVDGVPSRAGMEILIRSIQAQGRFVDKKPAFSDVADDRLAIEVARELGYKAL